MNSDSRQIEMFPDFEGSKKAKPVPRLVEGVDFGITCPGLSIDTTKEALENRYEGWRKGGPLTQREITKHCLVYCGDERCDCGRGPRSNRGCW